MIQPVHETIIVPSSTEEAFSTFVDAFGSWWPRAYTWSGSVLETIAIEGEVGGRCFERGPDNFHCDWGRVVTCEPPSRLAFLWQIGPGREPVPNPDHASRVEVSFRSDGDSTRVDLIHDGFDRHGEGGAEYREGMASAQGWAYILDCYRAAFVT